ncbi:hypothetical protein [Nannocystis pusilla]|uniref:hypothetical protein n=1 Tax=Nannocystis pusilla TaxID=889268 RepID=UPI003B7CBA1F
MGFVHEALLCGLRRFGPLFLEELRGLSLLRETIRSISSGERSICAAGLFVARVDEVSSSESQFALPSIMLKRYPSAD